MIKLAISGCQGRMGQAILTLAANQPKVFTIKTLLEHKDHPKADEKLQGIAIAIDNNAIKGSDVLIEFTLPEGTMANLEACVKHKVKMVIGTTGLNEAQARQIKLAAKKIPIVYASNMSIGVNVLFKLIEIAAAKIQSKNISITETHHIHKKDKPSGTAKTMAQIAEQFSKIKVVPVDSIREGEVVGFHEITFESDEDTLVISHNAKNRFMFAKGALAAARFLQGKKSGLFNMQDVLDLKNIH